MAWRPPYRTVVESAQVMETLDDPDAKRAYPRLDDAWEGLKWMLARSGQSMGLHQTTKGREFRLYKQAGSSSTPSILALYEADGSEVHVHDIHLGRAGNDE